MGIRLGWLDRAHPSTVFLGTFGGAILLGALMLATPWASHGPRLSLVDAFFMSTSATCVTGLTVVDPGSRLSPFGQAVLLALVQAGGLGIMTFTLFFANLMGRRLGFHDRMILQDAFHHSPTSELRKLLWYVVKLTLWVEGIGAALLLARLGRDLPPLPALWSAVFHSVASFCNAGFSLFPDNLVRYRGDLLVNAVVTALVIVGGLGFVVNMELWDRLTARRRGAEPRTLSLHTRLVLVVSGALLLLGCLMYPLLEWHNLLRPLGWGEKAQAVWFMSVTPRTAGFNTVDYGQATAGTLFFTIFLMFVGASPGSTGGGTKTTSLGLLVLLVVSRWRGERHVSAFHRSVPQGAVDRALSVTLMSWLLTSVVLGLLAIAEQGAGPYNREGPRFLALMFEVVSAFGTVGLSTGITPGLGETGKLLLCLLMFVGRVGPLTAALAIGRKRKVADFRFAEENVMVG